MVLGRPTAESTQYGKQDYTVVPIEGLDLADQLHDAVKYIRGTYQEAALPELGEGEDIDESLPADPNVKNYSYTVVDGAVYFRENSRMVRPDLNATAEARVKGLVGPVSKGWWGCGTVCSGSSTWRWTPPRRMPTSGRRWPS